MRQQCMAKGFNENVRVATRSQVAFIQGFAAPADPALGDILAEQHGGRHLLATYRYGCLCLHGAALTIAAHVRTSLLWC